MRGIALLQGEAVMPSQWEDMRRKAPQHALGGLAAAVLMDALRVLTEATTTSAAERARAEVLAWVEWPTPDGSPLPFVTACALAFPDLDPGAVREGMVRRMAERAGCRPRRGQGRRHLVLSVLPPAGAPGRRRRPKARVAA